MSKDIKQQIIKLLDKMVCLYDERERAEQIGGEEYREWDDLKKSLNISFGDKNNNIINEMSYKNFPKGISMRLEIYTHKIVMHMRVNNLNLNENCKLCYDFKKVKFFKYRLDTLWRKVRDISEYIWSKEQIRLEKIQRQSNLYKIEIVDKIFDIAFTDVDKILLGEEEDE